MENESLINQKLIESLDSQDKQKVLDSLTELIEASYKIELELRALKEFHYNFLEILPQAVWVLESNNTISFQNNQAYNLDEVLHIIRNSLIVSNIKAGQFYESELECKGSAYLLRINSLSNKIIITATDITNQKRQERLASMGQVSAHLAHEIRNPVGSIALLTTTLLKSKDIQTQNTAIEIKKSLWRIERLINATLLFSKGIGSKNQRACKLRDFKEELQTCISYYTYSAQIEFVFGKAFEGDEEIFVDFDLFGIVLQNFVFNAIDAIEELDESKPSGRVEIDFAREGGKSIFYVSDTGKAIEDKRMLFEAFKSTKLKGNGLGLALSQQIIRAHNGSITLKEGEGKKTFIVEIINEQGV